VTVVAQRVLENRRDAFDHDVHIHRSREHRLLSPERQELTRERRRALRGFLDLIDVLSPLRGAGLAPSEKLGVRQDDREQIIEIVRHSAGESANRLHLVRVTALFLDCVFGGEVADDDDATSLTRTPLPIGDDVIEAMNADPSRRRISSCVVTGLSDSIPVGCRFPSIASERTSSSSFRPTASARDQP
jgi:hypothetical protein